MNILFPLFYSPKPRNQVSILIYRNWSIGPLSRGLGRVANLIILKNKYHKKDHIKISNFAKFGDV